MSGKLSKSRLGRLQDVMAHHVDHAGVPGLVAMVARRGETWVETAGRAMLDGKAMRRDTIFRIASMTKPVMAVAALMLVEECRLRLDDPVDRILPELSQRRVLTRLDAALDDSVPAVRPISLRDLLTFRCGWGLVMAPPGTHPIQRAMDELAVGVGIPRPQAPPAPDEWLRRLGTLPLMHQPGERWLYHTGADLLGVLVARAADQPLETVLRERIFAPLGMKDTGFCVSAKQRGRLAAAYVIDGGTQLYDPPDGQWSTPPAFPSGGAGLVSTADDFLAFARMLLAGGKVGRTRLLSRPSIETMTADHLTPEQKAAGGLLDGWWDARGWGFGVSVVTRRDDPAAPVGSYGWDGGLGTSWQNDPHEEMITILLTQLAFPSPAPPAVVRDFRTAAYQAIDD